MAVHERPGIDALGAMGVDDPHMLAGFDARCLTLAGGDGDEVKISHGWLLPAF
jgi:hypothetical protein